MPEPMTANDLHDLVAPLWAAVPETVPTRLWFGAMSRLLWNDTHGRHEWERVGWCTDGEAEVWIIHAIEEWVLAKKGDLNTCDVRIYREWLVTAGDGNYCGKGPTRLHALVRLAMYIYHEDNTGDAGKEKR